MSETGDDRHRPDEARLDEYLGEMAAMPPAAPGTELVRRVTQTARWQTALRVPLRAAGQLAAAVVVGLTSLLGLRSGAGR